MSSVTELPAELCTNYKLKSNEKLISISIPSSKNPNGRGLVGILTYPPTSLIPEELLVKNPTSTESHYPPTHKLSVIVHGKGGHKNYCYQALLAQELASKLGTYSFRFDFRGCGDSQENEIEEEGRKILQDVEDIEIVLDTFIKGASFESIGINLVPNSIIGHSRGAVAMFRWALVQQEKSERNEPYHFVPNLINAAARYEGNRLLSELGTQTNHGRFLNQYRLGTYQDIQIPDAEVIDLAGQKLSGLKYIDSEIQVLSIYGLADHIVPLEDSSQFANLLGSRHKLVFIPHADHNYYGVEVINPSNSAKFNPENLPLNKRGRVNWNYKVTSEIINWLHTLHDTQRFKDSTEAIYYFPRWRDVEGIANLRDVGGWRTKDGKHYVKAGVIFRSANPSNVTERGKEQLKNLGITAFFDFRSYGEFFKNGGLEVDGITVKNVPVFNTTDLSPQAIALRYRNLLASWYTYKFVYRDILSNGINAFREVFQFIRDHPNEAFVFNCQAGKDRTGVMAMLILLLLDVDHHTIAKEYELTTIGLIPNHEDIKEEFYHMLEGFKVKAAGDPKLKEVENGLGLSEEQMFQNLISSKYESMLAAIELFNKEFGGVHKYLTESLGLSIKDLEIIRGNLLVKSNPYPDQNSLWRHRSQKGSQL